MTMPSERTRALRWAYELLVELQQAEKLTDAQKRQVKAVLRHYPTPLAIASHAKLQLTQNAIHPSMGTWLAPEDDVHGFCRSSSDTCELTKNGENSGLDMAYVLDDGPLTQHQIEALKRDVANHFPRGKVIDRDSLF
jgi:hypothetical protein